MTTEDQIVALFAKANPVPSLDLFDPVEPFDVTHLGDRSERSSVMTDVKTDKAKVKVPGRWPRLALGLAIPVIAVVAVVILVNRDSGVVASPQSVATAFMDAFARHDQNAARELVAPDGSYDFDQSNPPGVFDWERAVGWAYINQGCQEESTGPDGTLVNCPVLQENDWMRALGLEPESGNFGIVVADAQIQAVTFTEITDGGMSEGYRAFRAWVNANHPDDIATMFGSGDEILRNPDSIPLYEQHTDEFVASTSAPSTTTASPTALRLGTLPAGTYTVTPFAPPGDVQGVCMTPPQAGCSESPADDSMRFMFTVPDGWSGAPIKSIWLTTGHNSAPDGAGLIFERGGWLHSDPCRNDAANPDIPVGPTVDDFANALADHPLLDVTTPVDVTLDGYSGKYLDLQVPSDFTDCNRYYAWEPALYAQGPSQRWHLWILDVDGVRVVVETNDYPGTSAEDRAELQAIVDSVQIEP